MIMEKFYCRICGYRLGFEPWGDDGKLQPMKYVLVVALSLVMKIAQLNQLRSIEKVG